MNKKAKKAKNAIISHGIINLLKITKVGKHFDIPLTDYHKHYSELQKLFYRALAKYKKDNNIPEKKCKYVTKAICFRENRFFGNVLYIEVYRYK